MIRKKLFLIMQKVDRLQKDGVIKTRAGSFSVLTEPKLLTVLRPLFIEHQLAIFPTQVRDLHRDLSGDKAPVTSAIFSFTIYDVETDETLTLEAPGQGSDWADKGAGMAQTYAFKNALRKTLMLITGDDPDMIDGETQTKELPEEIVTLIDTAQQLLKEGKATEAEVNWLKEKAQMLADDPEKLKVAQQHFAERKAE